MKHFLTCAIVFCLAIFDVNGQTLPQGIAYQAVAVKDGPYSIAGQNPEAIYWSNRNINVRFTIYEKYPSGSIQYNEVHKAKTDDYGVFNLVIGQGDVISGDFNKIPWDLGTAHLQVEIDFDNNGTFKLTSLERFWSVPYAFVTKKGSSTSTDSAINALNGKFNYLKNRDKDTIIGNEGGVSYKSLDSLNKVILAKLGTNINDSAFRVLEKKVNYLTNRDKDTLVGNEWQKISRSGDSLLLSNGGGVVELLDEDPMNEIQQITQLGDTVKLSRNGGRVILSDNDSLNEIQFIGKISDTITLSQKGGIVVLNDDDSTNELQSLMLVGDTLRLSKSSKYVLVTPQNKTKGPFTNTRDYPEAFKQDLFLRMNILKRNDPWTSYAIYPQSAAWESYATNGIPYRYMWDVFFERNDTVFFFENGQGTDAISSYYFSKKNINYGGPTTDVYIKSGLAKEEIARYQTLGANKSKKLFYWINGNGLNVYDPFKNTITSTIDLHPSSKNVGWLSGLVPTSSTMIFLHMNDSNLFVFFRETSNVISFYSYNFITDTKLKIWDTKISTDKFGFPNQPYQGGFYTTRGDVLFNDSIFVLPFNGVSGYGANINGTFKFGYLAFDYKSKKIDTFYTDLNKPITHGFPKNKGLFLTSDNVLIDLVNRKVTQLNIITSKNWMSYPQSQFRSFPFTDKLYWLNVVNIQKGAISSNRMSITSFPDEYNYPFFYLDY